MAKDRIEYTIEMSTQESQEIKDLIGKMNSADRKFQNIKSERLGRQIFESGGSPIQEETGPTGPIFRGQEEAEEVSTISRGKKGKGAFERQDIFRNMQNRLKEVETKQTSITDLLTTGGGGLFLGLLKNPIGQAGKILLPLIESLAPYIAAILVAKGLADLIIDEVFRAGGVFDRRFKLMITKLVNPMIDRERLAQIRQGFAHVRVTSFIGPRGVRRGQVTSNINGLNRGVYVYDDKLERLTKGLY